MKALKKGILKRVSADDVNAQQLSVHSNDGELFYDAPEVRMRAASQSSHCT